MEKKWKKDSAGEGLGKVVVEGGWYQKGVNNIVAIALKYEQIVGIDVWIKMKK